MGGVFHSSSGSPGADYHRRGEQLGEGGRHNGRESRSEAAEDPFSVCSFIWAEAPTPIGCPTGSRLTFKSVLSYGDHLGLSTEEIRLPDEARGFPHAFHLDPGVRW